MAIGDQNDLVSRIKATFPPWYGDNATPLLDGVTSAYAWAGSFLYTLYAYAVSQTRIKTATDDFLELIANDYFGKNAFLRTQDEPDPSYRNRILVNLIRERATRGSVNKILSELTGREPKLFEPGRPADTGGYRIGGVGYGAGGGWGSLRLPYQAFVIAYRPKSTGVPSIAGYGMSAGGYSTPSQACYADINQVLNQVTDTQIYAAIDSVKVAGTTVWTCIQS